MTDVQPKVFSVPNMGLQAMNATGAFAYGDKIGAAVAKIVAWRMAVDCACAPPDDVIAGVHELCVIATIIVAVVAQHLLVKRLT